MLTFPAVNVTDIPNIYCLVIFSHYDKRTAMLLVNFAIHAVIIDSVGNEVGRNVIFEKEASVRLVYFELYLERFL
jgi:hypothetical protein